MDNSLKQRRAAAARRAQPPINDLHARAVALLEMLNRQKRGGGADGLTSVTPFLPGVAPGRFAVERDADDPNGISGGPGSRVPFGFQSALAGALRSGAAEQTHTASFEQARGGGASSADSGSEETSINVGTLLQNRTLRRNAERAWRESDPTGDVSNRREVGFWGRGSYDKFGRVTSVEIGRFIFGKRGLENNFVVLGTSPFSLRRGAREFLIMFHTHPYPLSHSIGPSEGSDDAPKGGFMIVRNRRGYCVMNEHRQTFGADGACTR